MRFAVFVFYLPNWLLFGALGPLLASLGRSWPLLGRSLVFLGRYWLLLGALALLLGALGLLLGGSWGALGVLLGRSCGGSLAPWLPGGQAPGKPETVPRQDPADPGSGG